MLFPEITFFPQEKMFTVFNNLFPEEIIVYNEEFSKKLLSVTIPASGARDVKTIIKNNLLFLTGYYNLTSISTMPFFAVYNITTGEELFAEPELTDDILSARDQATWVYGKYLATYTGVISGEPAGNDRDYVVCAALDKIIVFDVATGKPVVSYHLPDFISDFYYSKDGNLCAALPCGFEIVFPLQNNDIPSPTALFRSIQRFGFPAYRFICKGNCYMVQAEATSSDISFCKLYENPDSEKIGDTIQSDFSVTIWDAERKKAIFYTNTADNALVFCLFDTAAPSVESVFTLDDGNRPEAYYFSGDYLFAEDSYDQNNNRKEKIISLYDLRNHTQLRSFDAEGKQAIGSNAEGELLLWDSKNKIWEMENSVQKETAFSSYSDNPMNYVSEKYVSADLQYLFLCGSVQNTETEEFEREWRLYKRSDDGFLKLATTGETVNVKYVIWSNDNTKLFVLVDEQEIRTYDTSTGELLFTYHHPNKIIDIARDNDFVFILDDKFNLSRLENDRLSMVVSLDFFDVDNSGVGHLHCEYFSTEIMIVSYSFRDDLAWGINTIDKELIFAMQDYCGVNAEKQCIFRTEKALYQYPLAKPEEILFRYETLFGN